MRKVISKDGTQIAYDQSGEGLPIILVVGAFNDHSTGAPLAAQLSEHFTVFNYDRRGIVICVRVFLWRYPFPQGESRWPSTYQASAVRSTVPAR
jgi:hypothetical protein